MKRSEARSKFLELIAQTGKSTISRKEIFDLCESNGVSFPHWFCNDESNRAERGTYRIPQNSNQTVDVSPSMAASVHTLPKTNMKINSVSTELESANLVPEKYKNYVPFGNFDDIKTILASNRFFPIFITGQSGNGKTMSVEQVCAQLGRKFVCISMTSDTDESDLLGNFVLIDGQMVWRDGPVTLAARQGAVLCIDEIDYGAQNLSAIQRVLEGKAFLLKKKNELVHPQPGFTIVATANTKGKGSDDGRYMFTNVLNEAFLERFPITLEQDWAPEKIEKKIISKELVSAGRADDEFAEKLVIWANVIRKTFDDGGCDEVISTRRLVHIAQAYGMFGDRVKAISQCLNRFDIDTKTSFIDLYTKCDEQSRIPETGEVKVKTESQPPF